MKLYIEEQWRPFKHKGVGYVFTVAMDDMLEGYLFSATVKAVGDPRVARVFYSPLKNLGTLKFRFAHERKESKVS